MSNAVRGSGLVLALLLMSGVPANRSDCLSADKKAEWTGGGEIYQAAHFPRFAAKRQITSVSGQLSERSRDEKARCSIR